MGSELLSGSLGHRCGGGGVQLCGWSWVSWCVASGQQPNPKTFLYSRGAKSAAAALHQAQMPWDTDRSLEVRLIRETRAEVISDLRPQTSDVCFGMGSPRCGESTYRTATMTNFHISTSQLEKMNCRATATRPTDLPNSCDRLVYINRLHNEIIRQKRQTTLGARQPSGVRFSILPALASASVRPPLSA